ncbi:MAG: pentapeptide repeat-containing protein [Rhodobacteraceae bacterium]|nr:pentapeptide repeat-containing protein [Paracoccaceae bacterium]
MAEKLKDPNLPAGAIVKELENGGAIRNDGVELQPANKNRWYVLATIFGQQEEGKEAWEFDQELAARNRRAWNGWACRDLDAGAREKLAQKIGLAAEDLAPLTTAETAEIEERFKDKLGSGATLPEPDETVDLKTTYIKKPLGFEKYVVFRSADFRSATFGGDANFSSATFSGNANFSSATFSRPAYFSSATFSGNAYFNSATFSRPAYFSSATFSGDAYFSSATFSGDADFSSAVFSGFAGFRSTIFSGYIDFSSTVFKSATRFDGGRFLTAVPQFHAAELYDDTTFSLSEDYRLNWPKVSGVEWPMPPEAAEAWEETVMPAAEQKRAYNRLRLFYDNTLQVDEAMFFHRREMACKRQIDGFPLNLIYAVYSVVSDYGYSVVRPLVLLAFLWIVGAGVMLAHLGAGGQQHVMQWKAAGWSFANLFPFFGFHRRYFSGGVFDELPAFLNGVGGVQTVLGFVLLFFLGLGLRNRFRLR